MLQVEMRSGFKPQAPLSERKLLPSSFASIALICGWFQASTSFSGSCYQRRWRGYLHDSVVSSLNPLFMGLLCATTITVVAHTRLFQTSTSSKRGCYLPSQTPILTHRDISSLNPLFRGCYKATLPQQ